MESEAISEHVREIERKAKDLLERIITAASIDEAVALTEENLKPREGDAVRAFGEEAGERFATFYEGLWSQPIAPIPKPGQTQLLLWGATAEELVVGTARARKFPGGYAQVAKFVVQGTVWIRWKYVEPGESLGMAFDGMVWLDDHFAWFPKPWRALES